MPSSAIAGEDESVKSLDSIHEFGETARIAGHSHEPASGPRPSSRGPWVGGTRGLSSPLESPHKGWGPGSPQYFEADASTSNLRKRADQPEAARLAAAPPGRVTARHSFHEYVGGAPRNEAVTEVRATTPAHNSACGLLLPGSPGALSLGSTSVNGSPGAASKATGAQIGASMERVPSFQLDKATRAFQPTEDVPSPMRLGGKVGRSASLSIRRPLTSHASISGLDPIGEAKNAAACMSDSGTSEKQGLSRARSLASFQRSDVNSQAGRLSRTGSTILSVSSFSEKHDLLFSNAKAKRKKPRTELIDVDLVRGSTFSKKKPLGTGSRINRGFLRVFLLPLFRDYWAKEFSAPSFICISFYWAAHTASIVSYATAAKSFPSITPLEVYMPLVMLVLISSVYAAVAAPKYASADADAEQQLIDDQADNGNTSDEDTDVDQEEEGGTMDGTAGVIARIGATLYDDNGICHKLDISMEQISVMLLTKVSGAPENKRFLYVGAVVSVISALLPIGNRLYALGFMHSDFDTSYSSLLEGALGETAMENAIVITSFIGTVMFSIAVVFMLAVAEHTYFQRYLHAKYFSALTSSRRAKRYGLPHFRLHKVANIKMWLSLRSFIKRRGPQRSVDTIVSFSFLLVMGLVGAISLKSTTGSAGLLLTLYDWQIVLWAFMLSVFLLRFMTLGSHINQKFQSESLILTEQINLYLRMEQAPHKKDELGICNNVLNLSGRLLKEIESPYKISGMSMSPMMYNVTRVVVLSAFSSVVSDIFGFKLKIWKISKK